MTQDTYNTHKETLESGKIVVIGGHSAASVEELDRLRKHLPTLGGEGEDLKDTGRTPENREIAAAEQGAAQEALPGAETAASATAAQIATGARDNVTPKTLHDNATAEAVISEGEIAPQAGTEEGDTADTLSVPPASLKGSTKSPSRPE